jgi:Zn-dependent peptidase ImmA (M78 family)
MAALLTVATHVQAAPSIIISQNIKADCYDVSPYACFLPSTETIYISANTPANSISYLFLHEYGHYIMQNVPVARLRAMFGGANDHVTQELAADSFFSYVKVPAGLTAGQKAFISNQLTK